MNQWRNTTRRERYQSTEWGVCSAYGLKQHMNATAPTNSIVTKKLTSAENCCSFIRVITEKPAHFEAIRNCIIIVHLLGEKVKEACVSLYQLPCQFLTKGNHQRFWVTLLCNSVFCDKSHETTLPLSLTQPQFQTAHKNTPSFEKAQHFLKTHD